MRYFIFYKNGVFEGKGCSYFEGTIKNWLSIEDTREVSVDEYNHTDVLNFKKIKRVRYRLQLGVCTNCGADYSDSEQWCDEHEVKFRHLCGNCQIGTLPVVKTLAIKEY